MNILYVFIIGFIIGAVTSYRLYARVKAVVGDVKEAAESVKSDIKNK